MPQAILKFEQVKVCENQKRKVAPKEKSNLIAPAILSACHVEPVETRSFRSIEMPSTNNNQLITKFQKPRLAEVRLYFEEKDAPLEEAEKFYNHYESNGWLVGGKSKMKNWQAAARNWLLNSKRFYTTSAIPKITTSSKTNHLHATKGKSYQDPL